MLNVALTGNVAAGKSIVAQLFESWGATLIDSDVIVRQLQQPGTDVLRQMVTAFGPDILQDDGIRVTSFVEPCDSDNNGFVIWNI